MHDQALPLSPSSGKPKSTLVMPEMPSLSTLAREFLSNLPELLFGGPVNNTGGGGETPTNTPEIPKWK